MSKPSNAPTDTFDAFKQFEHEGWERVVNLYASVWATLTSQFIPPLLAAAGVGKNMSVLDVACGPGMLEHEANKLGARAVEMDFSREMVSAAHIAYPHIEFIEGDAEHLPFPDERFDRALINFGVLHFSHPEKAFTEAHRVLRPGGKVGFTVWAKPEANPGARIVHNAVQKYADMNVPLPEGPPYFLFSDQAACRTTLGKAGFDESSVKFTSHSVRWLVPTKRFLFDAELNAGVRSGGLLAHQTPENLEFICSAIEQQVEEYATSNGFAIPYSANIITATRTEA